MYGSECGVWHCRKFQPRLRINGRALSILTEIVKNCSDFPTQQWSKCENRGLYERETETSLQRQLVMADASLSSTAPEPLVPTAADIPGAELSVPYEAHPVPALKWWLLC